jgi:hypothetical protein
MQAGEADQKQTPEAQLEFFEKHVRPLLVEHCYQCHSATSKRVEGGLLLDTHAGLVKGGDSGSALDTDKPLASMLIEAIEYKSFEMPPKGKLPAADISLITRWVEMGTPWPEEQAPTANKPREEFNLATRKANHWVWQPIQNPDLPTITHTSWPSSPLDHFILAKLEQAGHQPAPPADRRTLARRLYFDITGLPPTPDQLTTYENDTRPDATAQLVDTLLESPHFGERWGRHWLDLVRYAESRGHEFDNDADNAFQYRDYIIRAFNADVPYDQLVREHIAGDLLTTPRVHPTDKYDESILGTGFWFLGEWVHSPVDIRKDESDRFDNMLDVMSKTFLGVTVACARCHDHKFDAISTEDYYALAGFLQSSDYRQVRFETMLLDQQLAEQLADLDETHRAKLEHFLKQFAHEASISLQAMQSPLATQNTDGTSSVVIDYQQPSAVFLQDGVSFGKAPRPIGEMYLAQHDGQPQLNFAQHTSAVSDDFWHDSKQITPHAVNQKNVLATIPRSGRVLRTPTFTLQHGIVDCRVKGAGHIVACVDSHRLIAGPLHGQTIKAIQPSDSLQWVRLDLSRYLGHRLHLEFSPDNEHELEVLLVLQGASADMILNQEELEKAQTQRSIQFLQVLVQALDHQSKHKVQFQQLVQDWSQARTALQSKRQTTSHLAMAMLDGTGENEHLLIRGNSSKPGPLIPRRFLTAVDGPTPMPIESGSGRLQLAERINDPSNPLTSRVIVNRIWHHLMGRGIVPTTDDFGVLGQRPTHPEFLDHLASRFLTDGRSIKQMIRYIVLSQTYQMSSQKNPVATEADPLNLLWHHHPVKRLEGEAIRDSLLTISGRFNPTMYGPSVPVHLTSFMDGRGKPKQSGPLDGDGRRSVYLEVRRNFLAPFQMAFDMPTPFSAMGKRNVSNVPAQALIMMNDPLVIELAQAWAKRAITQIPISEQTLPPDTRITWMYESAYARTCTEAELKAARNYLLTQINNNHLSINDHALWTDFAHVLINKKEFIYLR